jgi:hypothetical protein
LEPAVQQVHYGPEITKTTASRKVLQATKGFVQLGHYFVTIISSAYPSFGFGGRNSVGL